MLYHFLIEFNHVGFDVFKENRNSILIQGIQFQIPHLTENAAKAPQQCRPFFIDIIPDNFIQVVFYPL